MKRIILISIIFFGMYITTYAEQKIVTLDPYASIKIGNYYKIINNTNKKIMVPYTDVNGKILGNKKNFNKNFNFGVHLDEQYNEGAFTIRNLVPRTVTEVTRHRYLDSYISKWTINHTSGTNNSGLGNGTWIGKVVNKCELNWKYKTWYSSTCQSLGYPATNFITGGARRLDVLNGSISYSDPVCRESLGNHYRWSYDCRRNYVRKYYTTTRTRTIYE